MSTKRSAVPASRHDRRPVLPPAPAIALVLSKYQSTLTSSPTKLYEFADVKQISESPSKDRILVDVREPAEYAAGFIPTAINIPIRSQPDALFLRQEEFEDRFGFQKPATDVEVVFYCKSGVRSNAAAQLAQQNNYAKVSEYRGSWTDWEKKGGKASKP